MQENDLLDEFREGIKNLCNKINKEPTLRKMYYTSQCSARSFNLVISLYEACEGDEDTDLLINIVNKDKYTLNIWEGGNDFDDRLYNYDKQPINGKTYWKGEITADEVVMVLKDMWSKGLIAMEQVRDEFTKRHITRYREDINYND